MADLNKFPKAQEKFVVISEEEYDKKFPADQFTLIQKLPDGSRVYMKKNTGAKIDLYWNKRLQRALEGGSNDKNSEAEEK
jgi:hypothetical protein